LKYGRVDWGDQVVEVGEDKPVSEAKATNKTPAFMHLSALPPHEN